MIMPHSEGEEDKSPKGERVAEEDATPRSSSPPSMSSSTAAPTTTSSVTQTKPPVVSNTYKNSNLLKTSHRVSFRQELDNSDDFTSTNVGNGNRVSFRDEYNAGGFSDNPDNDPNDTGNTTTNTRRGKVGKADPIRDVGIVLAIFLFFYVVANSLTDLVSGPVDDGIMVKPVNKISQLEQMKQALGALLKAQARPHFENPLRSKDATCPLLLSPSRIPLSGWGLYAGQNYTAGQEIMILAPPSWPIQLTNHDDDPSSLLWVTPEAFLLKHHPTLANVESSKPLWTTTSGTDSTSTTTSTTSIISIHATRPIEQGQELFLDYHQHLHSILPDWYNPVIPTLDDYKEATEVLHQARTYIRDPPGPRGRALSKQQSVVGSALRMVQQVLARYRPAAAKLMGTTMNAIAQFRGKAEDVDCLELGLKNTTWNSLSTNGMCLHDVAVGEGVADTTDHEGSDRATTFTRIRITTIHAVPKGQRFYPIPVLLQSPVATVDTIHQKCMDETSSKSSGSCSNSAATSTATDTTGSSSSKSGTSICWLWAQDQNASLQVCPLQHMFLSNLVRMGKPPTERDEDDTHRTTTGTMASIANVKLEWSPWKRVTAVMDSKWDPPAELKDQLELLLMMDLIAIQDLEAGDELILAMDIDSTTGQWVLSPNLLPAHWAKTTRLG